MLALAALHCLALSLVNRQPEHCQPGGSLNVSNAEYGGKLAAHGSSSWSLFGLGFSTDSAAEPVAQVYVPPVHDPYASCSVAPWLEASPICTVDDPGPSLPPDIDPPPFGTNGSSLWSSFMNFVNGFLTGSSSIAPASHDSAQSLTDTRLPTVPDTPVQNDTLQMPPETEQRPFHEAGALSYTHVTGFLQRAKQHVCRAVTTTTFRLVLRQLASVFRSLGKPQAYVPHDPLTHCGLSSLYESRPVCIEDDFVLVIAIALHDATTQCAASSLLDAAPVCPLSEQPVVHVSWTSYIAAIVCLVCEGTLIVGSLVCLRHRVLADASVVPFSKASKEEMVVYAMGMKQLQRIPRVTSTRCFARLYLAVLLRLLRQACSRRIANLVVSIVSEEDPRLTSKAFVVVKVVWSSQVVNTVAPLVAPHRAPLAIEYRRSVDVPHLRLDSPASIANKVTDVDAQSIDVDSIRPAACEATGTLALADIFDTQSVICDDLFPVEGPAVLSLVSQPEPARYQPFSSSGDDEVEDTLLGTTTLHCDSLFANTDSDQVVVNPGTCSFSPCPPSDLSMKLSIVPADDDLESVIGNDAIPANASLKSSSLPSLSYTVSSGCSSVSLPGNDNDGLDSLIVLADSASAGVETVLATKKSAAKPKRNRISQKANRKLALAQAAEARISATVTPSPSSAVHALPSPSDVDTPPPAVFLALPQSGTLGSEGGDSKTKKARPCSRQRLRLRRAAAVLENATAGVVATSSMTRSTKGSISPSAREVAQKRLTDKAKGMVNAFLKPKEARALRPAS